MKLLDNMNSEEIGELIRQIKNKLTFSKISKPNI